MIAHGKEEFFVILPGCTATIQRQANDHYMVVDIALDTRYFEGRLQNTLTGLYVAEKQEESWESIPIRNGQLTADRMNRYRVVGISDGNLEHADKAANIMIESINKSTNAAGLFNNFTFHYTEGTGKSGGLLITK